MADYYELAAVQVNHISTEIPGMQNVINLVLKLVS